MENKMLRILGAFILLLTYVEQGHGYSVEHPFKAMRLLPTSKEDIKKELIFEKYLNDIFQDLIKQDSFYKSYELEVPYRIFDAGIKCNELELYYFNFSDLILKRKTSSDKMHFAGFTGSAGDRVIIFQYNKLNSSINIIFDKNIIALQGFETPGSCAPMIATVNELSGDKTARKYVFNKLRLQYLPDDSKK